MNEVDYNFRASREVTNENERGQEATRGKGDSRFDRSERDDVLVGIEGSRRRSRIVRVGWMSLL